MTLSILPTLSYLIIDSLVLCYLSLFYFLSYPSLSCIILSAPIYRILAYLTVSYPVLAYLSYVSSDLFVYRSTCLSVLSCLILPSSCLIPSNPIFLSYPTFPYRILSYPVIALLSYLILSYPVLSSLILADLMLSDLTLYVAICSYLVPSVPLYLSIDVSTSIPTYPPTYLPSILHITSTLLYRIYLTYLMHRIDCTYLSTLPTLSFLIIYYSVLSCLNFLSWFILSYPIVFYLILPYPILSYLIIRLHYLILSVYLSI